MNIKKVGVCALTIILWGGLLIHRGQADSPSGLLANGNIRHVPNAHQQKPPFPDVVLERSLRGQEAVNRMEDRLPEVAAWYGLSPHALRDLFRKDRSLWADPKGRLHYLDEELVAEGIDPQGIDSAFGQTYEEDIPLANTFVLHSSPESSKVLYLDFDGHEIPADSAWANGYNAGQSISAPAWDIDGNPQNFNDTELSRIQLIWRMMAEDFAAFDVDVTTEAPAEDRMLRSAASDQFYGGRVLFSPISSYFGNYGGIAYVGIFDAVGQYYQPALVFPERLSNASKYMGEAGSHEAGHNLGLNHDGTQTGTMYYQGHGDWAPIMGVGYYKPIVQWSKGEYADANNMQDDLMVIQSNGLIYSPDDHGAILSEATPLNLNQASKMAVGVIEKSTDKDIFVFTTTGGMVSLNVEPAPWHANLDIEAQLQDSFGNVIMNADAFGLASSIDTTLSAGTYYLSIDGVGTDNAMTGYSDYASLGQYIISGTLDGDVVNTPPTAVVSGYPDSGSSPLTIQFFAEDSFDDDGSIVSYWWDFGDGSASTEVNPLKTYLLAGAYTVTLIVQDDSGLTGVASMTVNVFNAPPSAHMEANPDSGSAPLMVNFDGSASFDPDGSLASYQWDFGDGDTASGVLVQHVYGEAGLYSAQLTVMDNKGAQDTFSRMIDVAADPNEVQPPINLEASVASPNVTLTWTDQSLNEEGFYIERSLKPKGRRNATVSYTVITQTAADVTQYTDTVSDGGYLYRVRAFNTILNKVSGYSNEVNVSVKTQKERKPRGGNKK